MVTVEISVSPIDLKLPYRAVLVVRMGRKRIKASKEVTIIVKTDVFEPPTALLKEVDVVEA